MKDTYKSRIEILQGTLDLVILRTLLEGAQHGYTISQAIRTQSEDVLQVDTGTLYPALHRLERKKWIAAEWQISEFNQRVRVYRLTATGKRQLESERSRWKQVSAAIGAILKPKWKENDS